jgi:hypothetical protein
MRNFVRCSRTMAAALILGIALGGCWLAPDPKGPDDPSGWEITNGWMGHGGERQELGPFTVNGPWGLEWELGLRLDASGFSRLKVELLDAQGKLVDTTIDTRQASHAVKRYEPGTYKVRVQAEGSSTRRWSVSWRVAIREKAGKTKAAR